MTLFAVLVSCLLVASCEPSSGPTPLRPPRAGPAEHGVFPGRGRILFDDVEGLQWAYPDGRVQVVARRFLGGELFPTGARLLAWKIVRENYKYFVMDFDGSNRQRIAGPGAHSAVALVRVSPDGTKVAYVRDWAGGARAPRRKLFVRDLVARRTTALGSFPPVTSEHNLSWNQDSLLLLSRARRGRAVGWINSANGERGVYLRVQDRRLVRAFRRAWPGGPSPSRIAALGRNLDPRSSGLAVLLSAPGRRRAVAVLSNKRTVAVPLTDRRPDVTFEWISSRLFLLATSRTIHQRNATFYLGTTRSAKLSPLLHVRDLHAGPILGPQGRKLLFLKGRGAWQFLSLATGSAAQPMKAPGTHGYPWEWAP